MGAFAGWRLFENGEHGVVLAECTGIVAVATLEPGVGGNRASPTAKRNELRLLFQNRNEPPRNALRQKVLE